MLVIGITGNSGSGKTLACRELEALGAKVLNADEIYAELVYPDSPLLTQIVCAFGKQYLLPDGSLDRKKMAELVFSDNDKRTLLNRITHPAVIKEIQARITAMAADKIQTVAVEAVALFENDMDKFMDEVWVIDATYQDKLARIMKRDSLSASAAAQRLSAQADPLILRQNAQRFITNDTTAEDLQQTIKSELRRLMKEKKL